MTARVLPFVRRGARHASRPRWTVAAAVIPPRGVHQAPYVLEGAPVLMATDSHGRWVAEVVLRAGITRERATALLQELLDSEDPQTPTPLDHASQGAR